MRESRLLARAALPVSSASLAFLRIAFGVAMVINTALYIPFLVRSYYIDTTFTFPYGPLTFVQPLPGIGMYVVYVAMAAAGAAIALGWRYRFSAATFLVLHTYVFLIDTTNFQNHEYLIVLLALLFWVLPLHCRWSLDARRRPELRSATVPAWMLWLLRFQIGVPYVYGGIAKFNPDWLVGEPLRLWLAARTEMEPMHTILTNGSVVWFMTYGSLLVDLLAVPLLLWRRTRIPAFVVVTCFHLLNAWLFGLFIFPWLMIAATTIFFAPDWPERAVARWRSWRTSDDRRPAASVARLAPPDAARRLRPLLSPLVVALLAVWVALQVLLPLRHLAFPGSPNWTEEGHRFAWHMMLRAKSGTVTFVVTGDDGTLRVNPAPYLNDKQTARLAGHPERLVHFARHLSDLHDGAEVRAETSVSLNGRDPQPLVDPDVDLSEESPVWWPGAPWIESLEEPLP